MKLTMTVEVEMPEITAKLVVEQVALALSNVDDCAPSYVQFYPGITVNWMIDQPEQRDAA